MEHQVVAPYDAVIASVEVAVGDSVETDQVLAVLEQETPT
jgi:biotin carboxyl carrier protein